MDKSSKVSIVSTSIEKSGAKSLLLTRNIFMTTKMKGKEGFKTLIRHTNCRFTKFVSSKETSELLESELLQTRASSLQTTGSLKMTISQTMRLNTALFTVA